MAEQNICEELVAVARDEDSKGRYLLAAAVAIAGRRPTLNTQEMAVLRRIAEGMRVQEIALSMKDAAPRTIELHLHSMREKLEASTNAEAVALAYEAGQFSVTPRSAL